MHIWAAAGDKLTVIGTRAQGFILSIISYIFNYLLQDTHREKAPSNKTPALRKSTNMSVWVVGTSNQLFISGS